MAELTGAFRFDPDRVLYEMDEIVAWLEANGVEAKDVPIDAKLRFDGQGAMWVDYYLRTEDGHRYREDGKPARGVLAVQLLVAPPDFKSLQPLGTQPGGSDAA